MINNRKGHEKEEAAQRQTLKQHNIFRKCQHKTLESMAAPS